MMSGVRLRAKVYLELLTWTFELWQVSVMLRSPVGKSESRHVIADA